MNNFVAAVIVEVIIGLLSWLRGQKARTVRNFVVVRGILAVVVTVEVTKKKTTTIMMTMMITAKKERRI